MSYKYPSSKIDKVEQNFFDHKIIDSFRWLEGDLNGNLTTEVQQWIETQNDFTRLTIDSMPQRSELEKRIKPLLEQTQITLPIMAGGKVFYSRRHKDADQPSFYMADSYDKKGKLLIDPFKLDNSGLTTVRWVSPSHDGELLAYGTYKSGDENTRLHIMRTNNPVDLPEQIEGKVEEVEWLPDSSGFIYSKLADINNPYSRQVRLHYLGFNPKNDPVIFSQLSKGPLATTFGPFAKLTADGKWLILGYYTGTSSNDLWLANFEKWQRTGTIDFKEISIGAQTLIDADIIGDYMYILSFEGASNGKVYKTKPNVLDKSQWEVFVDEREDAAIIKTSFTDNSMLIEYQHNASTVIESICLKTAQKVVLELPALGTATFSTSENRSDFFLSYQSFNQPEIIYYYASVSQAPILWHNEEIPIKTENIEVSQKWFESHDGTKVSMFLVHKKGIKLDGNNPTLVYGYGGFNIPVTPTFSPLLLPWFEDGGVYVAVNLRGGGEYGNDWHKAGTLDKKHRVFEDFEGALRWLINNKYSNPSKLAITGRSNGGLLTGAILTRAPELCKAVICTVPLLDMLRYQNFLMAKFWIPEYGSSENEQQFKYLLAYSPYHNIDENKNYPAVFFTAGENDARVHPMHARKMTAALQQLKSAQQNPVLLWVDRDSGHGLGKPLSKTLLEETDRWFFIRWQLGLYDS